MRFSEAAVVSASVEDSFDYVTDQSRLAEWNEHVQDAEVVGGGPVRVGSVLRQHRQRGNKKFDLTFEVIEHDRPHRHAVKGTVFGVDTLMRFEFAPHEGGPASRRPLRSRARGGVRCWYDWWPGRCTRRS